MNTQEKLIEALTKLWQQHREERFGQLIFNHTRIGTRMPNLVGVIKDPFFYQDEDILKDLKKALKT